MAKLGKQQIRDRALEIVAGSPGGIRYGELRKRIIEESPETPRNTIQGAIYDLAQQFPAKVTKPSRGLFMPAGAELEAPEPVPEVQVPGREIREANFYEPFAEWLKEELDEVTESDALGGSGLRSKWGTPDVVGVYKPLASNLIKFPIEVVSAEIKIDPGPPVVAFGQAIAYRLFSAKSYVVMPRSMAEEDFSRMEALSMLFGIGLVVFDLDPGAPNFEIRVRAQRFLPDMFYVNEFADRLRQHDPKMFQKLFG